MKPINAKIANELANKTLVKIEKNKDKKACKIFKKEIVPKIKAAAKGGYSSVIVEVNNANLKDLILKWIVHEGFEYSAEPMPDTFLIKW